MQLKSTLIVLAVVSLTSAWPHLPNNSTTIPSSSASSSPSASSGVSSSHLPSGSGSSKPGSVSVTGTGSQSIPSGTGSSKPGSGSATGTGTISIPSGTGIIPSSSGSHAGPTGTGHGGNPPITSQAPPTKTNTVTSTGAPHPMTKTKYITSIYTSTITRFVPCSTAVATYDGTTYYSSSLTTSLTTSTYTSVIPEYTVVVPAPGKGGEHPADNNGAEGVCPPASTVYVTVTAGPDGSIKSPAPISPGAPGGPGASGHDGKPQPPHRKPSDLPPYPLPSGSNPSSQAGSTGAHRPTGSNPSNPSGTGAQPSKPTATGH